MPQTPLAHLVSSRAPADDEALVARARAGDRAAFAQLFTRHHGRVTAMCTRLLADRGRVDDAVQQTFLEAWRCLHRFEGRSRFTTWLTRIAIHTCFGLRRRLARLVFVGGAGDEPLPELEAPGRTPEQMVLARAREAAIREVLASLSEKKRTVFVLADLEGLSSPEVAEVLGVPDATVRTRLFHARRAVAAAVRAHPGLSDLLDQRGPARGEGEP
ncbi:MAG: RNA polymerase sigma factor [Deltaproteobacteria bacterium]|nr:RNA polymerase sigma factor [Deltaproteobacteria bacterium]